MAHDAEQRSVYLHGVRADDAHWTDAWNFSLAGTRSSISAVNLSEGQTLPSSVPLDVLQGHPKDWPPMFISGFLATILSAGLARHTGGLGRGVPPYATRWADEASIARITRNADRELALESARRKFAPNAPSRLGCLWLADDNLDARNWIQRMLGHKSFLMGVEVTVNLGWARCDARWIDEVHERPTDVAAAEGYWSGNAYGEQPHWEVLLDGQVKAADAEELQLLRDFVRFQGPPSDLLGPPPATT